MANTAALRRTPQTERKLNILANTISALQNDASNVDLVVNTRSSKPKQRMLIVRARTESPIERSLAACEFMNAETFSERTLAVWMELMMMMTVPPIEMQR